MRSLPAKLLQVVWAAVLAFLILGAGQGIWGVLFVANIRTSPAVPWSVPVMSLALWLMWQYLGGKWWPSSTSATRKRNLRANRVPGEVYAWSFVAGIFAIVALAGYWIVLSQMMRTPPNALADSSQYPALTAALAILMASLVSPVTEEAAFRGYCQVILEREFSAPVAILASSFFFMLAHLTQGFFWPKLAIYFLVGVVFGSTAYMSNSTLPALPVHVAGDVIFFTLVWPHDAGRQSVSKGADWWLWIHLGQAILFSVMTLAAFVRLSRIGQQWRIGNRAGTVLTR